MGSFIGHVDEAVFFIVLAFWWMIIKFPRYQQDPSKYNGLLSYPLPCYPRIPAECILKILFPLCGFIGELANGKGPHFLDEHGEFQKLNGIQHMTIYGLFCFHGVIDLLTFYKCKVIPPGMNYLTIAAGMLWYGISFRWHADMPGKEGMEQIIHVMPTYVMFLVATVALLELWKGGHFTLNLVRIWGMLFLGTWFFHTSFMMYRPLGDGPNPQWDRHSMKNAHFIVAMFGAHVTLTLTILLGVYALCHVISCRTCVAVERSVGVSKVMTTRVTHAREAGYAYDCLDECQLLMEEESMP